MTSKINRGYYIAVRRYECYFWMVNTIIKTISSLVNIMMTTILPFSRRLAALVWKKIYEWAQQASFQKGRIGVINMFTSDVTIWKTRHSGQRIDHKPLSGKGTRAPPPKFLSGREADQARESRGNRAYSGPECSFTWILRVVYFPVKHSGLYHLKIVNDHAHTYWSI